MYKYIPGTVGQRRPFMGTSRKATNKYHPSHQNKLIE